MKCIVDCVIMTKDTTPIADIFESSTITNINVDEWDFSKCASIYWHLPGCDKYGKDEKFNGMADIYISDDPCEYCEKIRSSEEKA